MEWIRWVDVAGSFSGFWLVKLGCVAYEACESDNSRVSEMKKERKLYSREKKVRIRNAGGTLIIIIVIKEAGRFVVVRFVVN